ncbi:MAG TPA: diacylglycerol kinase family protein [Phototrophicaceae bacterium]|nr:diacylglycerol kinase family protein [Phototrophicaceae bacterium]
MTAAEGEAIHTGFKKIHVIMNPVSGLNPVPPETIENLLKQASIEWQLTVTEPKSDIQQLVKQALKDGADVIAAYGGDGTVMAVGEALIGSDVPFAILPAGTANVMSVELGVPQNLEAALKLACGENAAVRVVDVGVINNQHHFLLRVGIGLEAAMTVNTPREEKKRLGRIAYFKSAALAFIRSKQVRYRITVDGKRHVAYGVSCVICNSGNIGIPNLALGPEMSISDGLLDVIVMPGTDPRSVWSMFRSAFRSLQHNARRDGSIPHWQGKQVTVSTRRKQDIGLDGELLKVRPPLTATIIPRAVNVVIPAPADSAAAVSPSDHQK